MAADLRLVADAAERHAHELAVERPRDRLADRRLAGAGRPDQGQDRAAALVVRDAAVLAELAHGEVLDDAVLHVVEAGVIGVEHLPRVRSGRASPRDRFDHGTAMSQSRYVRIIDASPRAVAHRLEAPQLAVGLRPDVVRHAGLLDLRPVLLDDGALVLAELLADRVHLLAEEPLALLLLRARLDVVADAAAHLQLGEPLALELEGELEPLDDVDRLEQLDALGEADVGRVGARVGERAGLGDRAQELARCGRRRRAARGSPRRRRGTRARARASGRAAGSRRGAPRPRRGGGPSESVWAAPMTPRCRPLEARRRAPPPRQADALGRPRRRCRRLAYSFSCRGTSRTRSSSPTSTVRVTFMPGKTTVSSSGTSSRSVTSRFTLQSVY